MSRGYKPISWDDFRKARGIDKHLVRRVWLSGAALLWEQFWPAAWPLLGFVGLFVAASLFGLWDWLPAWLHLILLFSFFSAFAWGVLWICRSVRLPDLASCINRLERKGGEIHRPVTSLLDAPATPLDESGARHLWDLHITRVSTAMRRLKVAWPAAARARHDRFGVRAAILLFVAIGFVVSGEEAPSRLAAAMDVRLAVFDPAELGTLTAWVTPPDYTGHAPIFLTNRPDAADLARVSHPFMVAEGSRFVARVHGGKAQPVLQELPVGSDSATSSGSAIPFQSVGDTNYSVEHEVLRAGPIQIFQSHAVLGQWEFGVIVDEAPQVGFSRAPQKTHKEVSRLGYHAEDDYGIAEIVTHIKRSGGDSEMFTLALRVPGGVSRSLEETSYLDLTPHPWAGLPVTIQLVARDVAGKSGESPWVNLLLPARAFKHPVAKAIIDQRRTLALGLDGREAVGEALDIISQRPEEFGGDVVAYMSLRTAVTRLGLHDDTKTRASVIDLLWEVALRIEDGTLSVAERDLRASEEALRDALDRNASNDEILELTRDLQRNLDQFLELLQSQGKQDEQGPFGDSERAAFDPDSELPQEVDSAGNRRGSEAENRRNREKRNRRELQELVEKARDLALTGSREAAQSMLQELQETIENLQRGQSEQTSGGENRQERDIEALEDVAEEQDALLNETFEQLRGDKGEASAAALQNNARQRPGEVVQEREGANNKEPPDLRDDHIERMDDLSMGDPAPTADRQSNSAQQTEGPQPGRDELGNDVRTRGDQAGGDQRSSMAPRTRDAQQQESSGGDRAVSPSQAARGGEGAEGGTRQTGVGRNARQHSDSSPKNNIQRQEELKRKLGDVMRDISETGEEIPSELGEAEQFMRDAVEALARGRPDRAVRSQTQALNQLRQGAATLRGRRTNDFSRNGETEENSSQRFNNQRDPFGRRSPGKNGDPTGYVEIPEVSDIQRSRKILDELYRRAGDSGRSERERSYIERLLRWY